MPPPNPKEPSWYDALGVTENATLYEILGVDKSATTKEIASAYHKLSLKYHTDKAPADKKPLYKEVMQEINHAKEILLDDEKRKIYNIFGKYPADDQPPPASYSFKNDANDPEVMKLYEKIHDALEKKANGLRADLKSAWTMIIKNRELTKQKVNILNGAIDFIEKNKDSNHLRAVALGLFKNKSVLCKKRSHLFFGGTETEKIMINILSDVNEYAMTHDRYSSSDPRP